MRLHLVGLSAMVSVMAAFGPAGAAGHPTEIRLRLDASLRHKRSLAVPANTALMLVVENAGPGTASLDCATLGIERIIPAGADAMIRLGPLQPGEYHFNDDASGLAVMVTAA